MRKGRPHRSRHWRHIKAWGPTPDSEWKPIGYYANRPHIFDGINEIGMVESVRFVVSKEMK